MEPGMERGLERGQIAEEGEAEEEEEEAEVGVGVLKVEMAGRRVGHWARSSSHHAFPRAPETTALLPEAASWVVVPAG